MDKRKLILPVIGLLFILPVSATGQGFDLSNMTIRNSNDAGDTTYGAHGGRVTRREKFVFESVIDPEGIRIYVYDSAGRLLDLENAGGTVKFPKDSAGYHRIELQRNKDPKKRRPPFRGKKCKRGYYLFAPYDFSLTEDGKFNWGIIIFGLPKQELDRIRFNMQIGLTRLRGWACRGHEQRIFMEYKDYPLCEKRYLQPAPFLYQCPLHAHSRAIRESKCPLCSTVRVPTRQSPHPFVTMEESGRLKHSTRKR